MNATSDNPTAPAATVTVAPWPSETPLFVLVLLASLSIWAGLVLSIFGAVYALVIAIGIFFVHLLFIVHVRGSAVKLGPEQFPELDRRVRELGERAGIGDPPAAYVMEAGGALNALATKFLRSRLIVLYSDLLEACASDPAARDMVIGHELGHVKQGHLRLSWLLAPGMFVPFLGAAYSRARERTCDRWGAALCGDPQGALRGLAILAAGGRHGPQVNLRSFTGQRQDLDTGWMTLGRWLSTYPTLAERVAALDPALDSSSRPAGQGAARAAGILAVGCLIPVVLSAFALAVAAPRLRDFFAAAAAGPAESRSFTESEEAAGEGGDYQPPPPPVETIGEETARIQATGDLARLAEFLESYRQANGLLPEDDEALFAAWEAERGEPFPPDPFDGAPYGYRVEDDGYLLWSSGPDRQSGSDDDIARRP
jgi:Zn-dependent protease with chaperone function